MATVVVCPDPSSTVQPGAGVSSFNTRTGDVVSLSTDYASFYDPLGSAQAVKDDLVAHEALLNPHATTLDSLPDTSLGLLADEQLLIYRSGSWANAVALGAPNGVCPLGADGKVAQEYMAVTGMVLKGFWDAAANNPDLTAVTANNGEYWEVAVPGSTDLNGITNWQIGDWAVWLDDEPGNWARRPNPSLVASVFGRTGNIVKAYDDYDTDDIRNVSPVGTDTSLSNTLNVLSIAIDGVSLSLTNHQNDLTVHYVDAAADGGLYGRQNNAWVAISYPVDSVFGRTGIVVAEAGDYTSTLVTNSSTVPGGTVTAALDSLQTGVNNNATNLINHAGDTTIHIVDVSVDGNHYLRSDNAWVLAAATIIANDSEVAGDTVSDALDRLDSDISQRPVWKGAWNGGPYEPLNMVSDDGGLFISNKATSERAAPQAIGPQVSLIEEAGTPSFVEQSVNQSALIIGQRLAATEGNVFIQQAGLYIPDDLVGFKAELWIVRDPTGNPAARVLLPEFTITLADTEQWLYLPIGSIFFDDSVAADLVGRFTPTVGENSFNGTWDYKRSNGDPGSGEINHQSGSNQNQMRVHQNDEDDDNRTADLDNIGAGSKISMGTSGFEWTVLSASKSGSVYTFIVEPASRAQEDKSNFTFTYYDLLPIPYYRADNHYAAIPSVQGFEGAEYDGPNMTLNNHAYGVDVRFRDAQVSDDWDVMVFG